MSLQQTHHQEPKRKTISCNNLYYSRANIQEQINKFVSSKSKALEFDLDYLDKEESPIDESEERQSEIEQSFDSSRSGLIVYETNRSNDSYFINLLDKYVLNPQKKN